MVAGSVREVLGDSLDSVKTVKACPMGYSLPSLAVIQHYPYSFQMTIGQLLLSYDVQAATSQTARCCRIMVDMNAGSGRG